jgi:hypothetical protein
MEQNAQAKIQFWNAVRKIIPAMRTIAKDTGQRNEQWRWIRHSLPPALGNCRLE